MRPSSIIKTRRRTLAEARRTTCDVRRRRREHGERQWWRGRDLKPFQPPSLRSPNRPHAEYARQCKITRRNTADTVLLVQWQTGRARVSGSGGARHTHGAQREKVAGPRQRGHARAHGRGRNGRKCVEVGIRANKTFRRAGGGPWAAQERRAATDLEEILSSPGIFGSQKIPALEFLFFRLGKCRFRLRRHRPAGSRWVIGT